MVRYKRQENQLIIFADDTHPRWITCTTILDYDTVATADKFGNIAIVSATKNLLLRFGSRDLFFRATALPIIRPIFVSDQTFFYNFGRRRRRSNGKQGVVGQRFVERSFAKSRRSGQFSRRRNLHVSAKIHADTRRFRISRLHHFVRNGRRSGTLHVKRRPRLFSALRDAHEKRASTPLRKGSSLFPILLLPSQGDVHFYFFGLVLGCLVRVNWNSSSQTVSF